MTSLRWMTMALMVTACGDAGSGQTASDTQGSTGVGSTADASTAGGELPTSDGSGTDAGTGTTTTTTSTVTTATATSSGESSSDETTGEPPETTGGEVGCEPSLPTFVDGKSPTNTLYVTAGAMPGGDGSEAKPFATLDAGLKAATPGTRVLISGELPAATYTTGLSGSADAPIWISGEPGAKIGSLTLQDASHIVVEDLELAASDSHVLHFFFADHLMLRRLKIHDAGLGCIKGSQTTQAYVEHVEAWAAGQKSEHPVLDYVGVNDGHIVHSEFREGPGVMIMLKGGTSDLLFAWNEVHQQSTPGNALAIGQSTSPEFFQPIDSAFEGLRIVAFANLLHDLVGAPVAFEGCKDCAAVRNTIWDCTGLQLVRFLPGKAGMDAGVQDSLSEGCRFTGNIVVGGQANGASLNADDANTGPGNVLDHNVFLKPGGVNWWGVIEQEMLTSTYDQDPQLDAGGVPQNVPLVDGKGPGDLAGLPFADVFVQDAAGACIQQPPDIGAFEVP